MAERRSSRCAIYTRKSSEEGLDQDFNSLDAQREACEAFIRSQRSEGWILVEKGEMPRALELLRKANTLAPEMGDMRYHMAVALHRSGRSGEARRELERLLDSDRRFSMQNEARYLLQQLIGG